MILVFLLLTPPALAMGNSWSAGTGSWFVAGNWTDLEVPGSQTNAYIDNAGTAQIQEQSATCWSLLLGSSGNSSGSVSMGSGSLDASSSLVVGSSGTGTFTQSGGSVGASGVKIGSLQSGTGTYTMQAGQGADPTLSVSYSLQVGCRGEGTFEQHCGTVTVNGLWLNLATRKENGSTVEPHGIYRLYDGATLNTNTTDGVYVGDEGLGEFEQSGGTHTIDYSMRIGWRDSDTMGTTRLGDGIYTISGGNLTVGTWCAVSMYASANRAGRGKMVIKGTPTTCPTVKIGSLYVGASAGHGGTLQIGDADDEEKGVVNAKISIEGRYQCVWYSNLGGPHGPTNSLAFGPAGTFLVEEPGSTRSTCTFVLKAGDADVINQDVVVIVVIDEQQVRTTKLPGFPRTTFVFTGEDIVGEQHTLTKRMERAGKFSEGIPSLGAFVAANYALGGLVVGYYDPDTPAPDDYGPVTLALDDEVDNQDDGDTNPEALYTLRLSVAPGGTFPMDEERHLLYDIFYVNDNGQGDPESPKRLYMGDANLDGVVDFADYQILEANFGEGPGMTWADGDFNGDRYVNYTDYLILQANYESGLDAGAKGAQPLPALKDYDEDGDIDADDMAILKSMEDQ